ELAGQIYFSYGFLGWRAALGLMQLEKAMSLVFLLMGAVFLLAAGVYIPGTNILIEPTVRVLMILSYFAFGAGVVMFLISRGNDRKNPAFITPTPVELRHPD